MPLTETQARQQIENRLPIYIEGQEYVPKGTYVPTASEFPRVEMEGGRIFTLAEIQSKGYATLVKSRQETIETPSGSMSVRPQEQERVAAQQAAAPVLSGNPQTLSSERQEIAANAINAFADLSGQQTQRATTLQASRANFPFKTESEIRAGPELTPADRSQLATQQAEQKYREKPSIESLAKWQYESALYPGMAFLTGTVGALQGVTYSVKNPTTIPQTIIETPKGMLESYQSRGIIGGTAELAGNIALFRAIPLPKSEYKLTTAGGLESVLLDTKTATATGEAGYLTKFVPSNVVGKIKTVVFGEKVEGTRISYVSEYEATGPYSTAARTFGEIRKPDMTKLGELESRSSSLATELIEGKEATQSILTGARTAIEDMKKNIYPSGSVTKSTKISELLSPESKISTFKTVDLSITKSGKNLAGSYTTITEPFEVKGIKVAKPADISKTSLVFESLSKDQIAKTTLVNEAKSAGSSISKLLEPEKKTTPRFTVTSGLSIQTPEIKMPSFKTVEIGVLKEKGLGASIYKTPYPKIMEGQDLWSRASTRFGYGTPQDTILNTAGRTESLLFGSSRTGTVQRVIERQSSLLSQLSATYSQAITTPRIKFSGFPYAQGGSSIVNRFSAFAKRATFGYQAYVKRFGKWLRVGKPAKTRAGALGMGSYYAETTAARSFLVKAISTDKAVRSPYRFSTWRFYKKGDTFIEKARYSINTRGELAQISRKGWEKRRRL